ncbi:hypothetical protein Tco_0484308 [Tanacetum coccineum]
MGDENPIRTLGDYSKPSHEGYRNTIELPVGNNVGSDVKRHEPTQILMKLTDERPTETDIRLSLASHSYIYPIGIAEDVLVEVAEHVYPVDFVILDHKKTKTCLSLRNTIPKWLKS